MYFGSHVYGTNTPSSDTDYKGVFLPSIEDCILQRVPKTSINTTTGEQNSKNSADDVDYENFTLNGFLRMCNEGQISGFDMLFTPPEFWMESSPEWEELIANRDKLIHKKVHAYVGYCRKQASKYGIRGSRIAELREVLSVLRSFPQGAKLGDFAHVLENELVKDKEFTFIIQPEEGTKNHHCKMLECCGRKMTYTTEISMVTEVFQKILDNYGSRALLAEKNEGVDWKAVSHAMRCCYQAKEMLETGVMTLPLPNADYILDIKKGKIEYPKVAAKLEEMMAEVEAAHLKSTLQDHADKNWIDNFILKCYDKEIIRVDKELTKLFDSGLDWVLPDGKYAITRPNNSNPKIVELVKGKVISDD